MTPNRPKTPIRTFRAGDEYEEAKRIAESRGENVSEHVLRPALVRYVKRFGKEQK